MGQEPPIPSLLQEPIFPPPPAPQGKQGSLESQQRIPGGRCLATMGSGPGMGRVLAACPLWRHYAIPGPLVRIEAMPRGLWVRNCHLVKWFVLSTTDLCQEDQGPNRNPWPALYGHTQGRLWLFPAPPLPQKPRLLGCLPDVPPTPPMAAQSPAPACGHEAGFQGPAWPLPSRPQAVGGSAHCPSLPWGLWGGLQLEKHQEALHSPLGLLYISSFYS